MCFHQHAKMPQNCRTEILQEPRVNTKRHQTMKSPVAMLASSTLLWALLAGCGPHGNVQLRAQANALQAKGDMPGAVVALKGAIAASHDDAATRLQLAKVYLEMGDAPCCCRASSRKPSMQPARRSMRRS
jgi:hypothetical protein